MATSLRDVAKACSLSVNAVSEILNRDRSHLYRPQTVELVRKVAKKLDYRPNRSARGMRSGSTGVVAVIGQNTNRDRTSIWHHHRYSFLIGLSQTLLARNKHLVLLELDEIDLDVAPAGGSRLLREVFFDALVVLNHDGSMTPAQIEERVGVPVVWYDARVPDGPRQVARDEAAVGRLLATELLARGHRRIQAVFRADAWEAFHTPGEGHFSFGQRVTAFRSTLAEAGAELDVVATVAPGEVAPRLRAYGPTAVVVDGMNEFLHVLTAAGQAGLAVPRDLSLAAFDVDGRKDFFDFEHGGVVYDRYAAGEAVAAMVADLLAQGDAEPAPVLLPSVFRAGSTIQAITRRRAVR